MEKIAVAGLWHLGLVSAAGFAEKGFQVAGFEPDESKIRALNEGKLPLFEPGLETAVHSHLKNGRLKFTAVARESLQNAKTLLLTYDTPVDEQDRIDLLPLEASLRALLPFLEQGALVIINSQVPVGTSEKWQAWIESERAGMAIDLVYSPENLRLGQALELFKKPDMIVIGAGSERGRKKAKKFFETFPAEKFFVDWKTAEMAKHALNAFFATSISFANEMGALCDASGADGIRVAQILKADSRIGKKAQVRPGLGFAGGTLARDLRALQNLGKNTATATPLTDTVLSINENQIHHILRMLEKYYPGSLTGKTLTVWGLTYKPGTSTLRRSPSLQIMDLLRERGVKLKTHDPKADLTEYKGKLYFEHCKDAYDAAYQSDGILLMTEWPEYRGLDFSRIKSRMRNAMVLDAKNHLDGKTLRSLGFTHLEIGRGQLKETKISCASES